MKMPAKNKRPVRKDVLLPQIHRRFKQEISNMRIRAHAMTRQSVHWPIGAKVYEPEKILHFVDAVWKRMEGKPSALGGTGPKDPQEALVDQAAACNGLLKALARRIDAGEDSQQGAEQMFSSLKALVVEFLNVYFCSCHGEAHNK